MLLRLMFSIDDGDMRALLPCMRVYVYMLSLLYEAKNTIYNAIGNDNHKNSNLNHRRHTVKCLVYMCLFMCLMTVVHTGRTNHACQCVIENASECICIRFIFVRMFVPFAFLYTWKVISNNSSTVQSQTVRLNICVCFFLLSSAKTVCDMQNVVRFTKYWNNTKSVNYQIKAKKLVYINLRDILVWQFAWEIGQKETMQQS